MRSSMAAFNIAYWLLRSTNSIFISLREEQSSHSEIPIPQSGRGIPKRQESFQFVQRKARTDAAKSALRSTGKTIEATFVSSALMSMKADRDRSLRSGFQKKACTGSAECNRLFNCQDN